jgi:hypothetical protein
MDLVELEPYLDHLSLALAGAVSFGYAAFLTTWVSRRVFPRVPRLAWWKAGTASTLITVGAGLIAGSASTYAVIAAFVPIFLLSAYVDAKAFRIPNAYVVHGMVVSIITGTWLAFSSTPGQATAVAWSSVLSAGVFVALLGVNIGFGGKLGMGDVKLGPVLAFSLLLVGAHSSTPVALGSQVTVLLMLVSVLLWLTGSFMVGGLWILVRGTKRLKDGFPFGPFMVLSWVLVMLCTPAVTAALLFV